MDGFMVEEIDISPWWSSAEDFDAGGQMNGGPRRFGKQVSSDYICLSGWTCLTQMVDPGRFLDSGDPDDLILWENRNGDYTLDKCFEETSENPWVCNYNPTGPWLEGVNPDKFGFCAGNAYDLGALSFGLIAPDGTGMGYYSYAGETAGWKQSQVYLCDGTPFDGLYTDDNQSGGNLTDWHATDTTDGAYFLGYDAITGIITNEIAVEETAPAAFAVDQNAPNPFNPTTTISFNLADAGNVSIEVYNVAGQNVDTIADGFMDAGSHSVVWDASDFSAGLYFYTVKSGGFSKTIKMTLLK